MIYNLTKIIHLSVLPTKRWTFKVPLWYFLSFFALFQMQANAQHSSSTQENRSKLLQQAESLMTSKRSRSATAITDKLMTELKEEGQYNSSFGYKVRLIHGSALIHADTGRVGLKFLLALKEDSRTHEQWVIYAEICRVIASELEFAGRKKESLANLRSAQSTIQKHHLDSIYPHFAVRIASWHRVFGDRDSSIFYAEEAIRTAQLYGKTFEEAEGNLLLGLNFAKKNPEKAIAYFINGAKLYKDVEEYSSFCSMYFSMAKIHLFKGLPQAAMANIDTALLYLPLINENNIEQLYRAHILKGDAFEQLGQLDSALFYQKSGYEKELAFVKALNHNKIVEIDDKYSVEQKAKELKTKNLQLIQIEKNRDWLIAFALMVLLFTGILTFYYLRLQKVNEITTKQSELLKNLDVSKSRFFANISHELRTPLTLLLGPINSLLKDGSLTEKQTKMLQIASQSGTQLRQLVDEILDLRKIEMNKMGLYEKPTLLGGYYRNFCSEFKSLAERKNISITFESNLSTEQYILIDIEKFRQILQNLLSNAFKFTPVGGRIAANLSLVNGSISLRVSDNGPGIYPEDLPHVFDRYFQTNRPDKPAEGGTGIGLNICQEYVWLFGGTITVSSTLGQGSVFEVLFPAKLVAEPELLIAHDSGSLATNTTTSALETDTYFPIAEDELKNDPKTAYKNSKKAKSVILVVEDNTYLQDYISLVLSEKYEVIVAENGQAALETLNFDSSASEVFTDAPKKSESNSIMPDLILSDLMMPVMDGYQLLEKLKSNDATRHIPVVMLTARAELEDRLTALRIGVDDYMTKPFDEEELLIRIENLLNNQLVRKLESLPLAEKEIPRPVFSQEDQLWLEGFEAYLQKNYSSTIFSISNLATTFAMSESTLLRQLKRLTGLSPSQYLQEMRLGEARKMLENKQYNSISQVATKVGFQDTRSFSRSFKQRFGKLPSAV